ncbi:Meiotic recombination protein rec12 [Madurella mycetomatis]|uniref:DNA topoisomerase (ATP-hydrolyzing) n=1 Tax=Madurella mycetomatis TaxID=100816 RepID=A0A175W2C2_9PEZI|nr:Meiotic recombination protein rec12 [Madurella mycetomatis]
MFSAHSSQQWLPNSAQYSRRSSVSHSQSPPLLSTISPNPNGLVQVPAESRNGALSKIENLLETILEAINTGAEMVIPYQSVRSLHADPDLRPTHRNRRPSDGVRFPGRTIQEARKFGALFRILDLSHEALLSGKLITKRNIYYQNPELFKTQSVVDDMVDSLAFTLGVGRDDLNIVAAAKGLISGPIELTLSDGSVNNCGLPSDTGLLLPAVSSIQKIDFGSTGWLLIIEKEATFRTLAASQYSRISKAGYGILLTAKGFPDLATRRFVSMLQKVRPELNAFALVDFDPHGIAIMRTYKNGSQRLSHEQDITAPRLRWLGIRSDDILSRGPLDPGERKEGSASQTNQEFSCQESMVHSLDDSQNQRPAKRTRVSTLNSPNKSISLLSPHDRARAVDVMRDISLMETIDNHESEQMYELQRMLILNIKAEIQAVDNFGDIADWLDTKLSV